MENLDLREKLFSLAQQKSLYGSLIKNCQDVGLVSEADLVAATSRDEINRSEQELKSDVLNCSYGI